MLEVIPLLHLPSTFSSHASGLTVGNPVLLILPGVQHEAPRALPLTQNTGNLTGGIVGDIVNLGAANEWFPVLFNETASVCCDPPYPFYIGN